MHIPLHFLLSLSPIFSPSHSLFPLYSLLPQTPPPPPPTTLKTGHNSPRSRKILILLPYYRRNIKNRFQRLTHTHDNNQFHQRLAQPPEQCAALIGRVVFWALDQVLVKEGRQVGLPAADEGRELGEGVCVSGWKGRWGGEEPCVPKQCTIYPTRGTWMEKCLE